MTGPRALALGLLAGWVLATAAITAGAALGLPLSPWTYPVGVTSSFVLGWGLPAIWFQTWRAVPQPRPRFPGGESPETPEAPPSPGGDGASGGARYRP